MELGRARRSAIAVQISNNTAQFLQVETRRDSGRVLAFAEVESPRGVASGYPTEWAETIRRTLKTRGFKGCAAVTCVPAESLLVRHAKVAASEGRDLQDALLFEVEDAFPDDAPMLQSVHVGEVTERGARRQEHILMAVGLHKVERLVEFLAQTGLEVQAVDVEAGALLRSFLRRRRRRSDAEGHMTIVHIGETVTLTIIASTTTALFMKQLPIGMMHLRRELKEKLDLGRDDIDQAIRDDAIGPELAGPIVQALRLPIDSLVNELAACLRYHAASRRSPVAPELVLCGVGSLLPGFADAVSAGLGQGYSRPDPFTQAYSGIDAHRQLSGVFAAWCVPLGLALRGVDP